MNTLKPKPGDTLAVWGVGGIGASAIMVAHALGCKTVIAVDLRGEKLTLARDIGATHVVNAADSDPVEAIHSICAGGVDFAIDAAGAVQTIEQAFASIRRNGGLCVFASHPPVGEKISLDPFELICGKRIRGSWGGDTDPDRDFPIYAKMYRSGHLPLAKLLTHTFELKDVNAALKSVETGMAGRALLRICQPE